MPPLLLRNVTDPVRRGAGLAIVMFAIHTLPANGEPATGWLTWTGTAGPAVGKRIVLIGGDEEYRSEEALPMLAQVLADRHGFTCTVLLSQDDDGTINPDRRDLIPGLDSLRQADLMVIFTRFRALPDGAMREIDGYLRRGKPVIGLRTATHAFALPDSSAFGYFSHDYSHAPYEGGFGRRVLGEQWVSHHGSHGQESTRGWVEPQADDDAIVRGVRRDGIWGPSDVYTVRTPLLADAKVLVRGEVLAGMTRDSLPVAGDKNNPRLPIAWTRSYTWQDGPAGRVFATTMGASQDFQSEDLRRLFVNACYWAVGLEDAIPARSDVRIVGHYNPTPFGFGKFRKGQTLDQIAESRGAQVQSSPGTVPSPR